MKGYFTRWRRYGWSCAGHTAQGFGIGMLILGPNFLLATNAWPLSVLGCVLAIAYIGYQAGSGARKAVNHHQTDSIGWDIADMSVGLWLAFGVWVITIAHRAGWF